jgi:hypothetical protein
MAVRIAVLRSGEQLISELTENLDNTIVLKKPFLIVMAAPGKIGLVDYLPYAKIDNGITLQRSDVMLIVEPAEDMRNYHAEISGGGLVVPPEKKVAAAGGLKLVT